VRFLNKFYSFLKSIYLNDSKYNNNLRHTLRIFFEREVKTRHTPTLFGALFKGSKWSDYQTYNINKLLIKSGLSYFLYLLVVILLVFFLMGRSKSEQYLGFLPIFSYVNFVLGFIPLLFHDLWSQVLFTAYVLYLFVLSWSTKLINKLSLNFFYSLSSKDTTKFSKNPNVNTLKTLHNLNLAGNNTTNSNKNKLINYSKNISSSTLSLDKLKTSYNHSHKTLTSFNFFFMIHENTTKLLNSSYRSARLTTLDEVSYMGGTRLPNFTLFKNYPITPHTLFKLNKIGRYPLFFDFNINQNLFMSKQQRWITRNSLLNSSIINNSFLVTQTKKLIGSGVLNKDLSTSSLWLPTKTSKQSSLESYLHLNNLSTMFSTSTSKNLFLKSNGIKNSTFGNLNFFENSRLWVFKKYFFTNQQANNLILSTPKLNSINNLKPNTTDYTGSSFLINHTDLTLTGYNSNPYTPSMSYEPYNKVPNNKLPYTSSSTRNTSIHLNNLDIITGTDLNLFFILTSSPQNYLINTALFSNYTNWYQNSTYVDYKNIKFNL